MSITSHVRKRLSIFMPTLRVGGAERVVVDLSNGLVERGWTVDILTMNEDDGQLHEEVRYPVSCHALGAVKLKDAIGALARFYDSEKPDIVLGTLYMNDVAAVIARLVSRHKPKIVAGAHNSLRHKIEFPDNRKDKYLLNPLCRLFMPRADLTIGVSKGVVDEVRELTHLRPELTRVIYNPVYRPEIDHLATEKVDHPWLQGGDQVPVLVWVGRLIEQKGLFDLIRAFHQVNAIRPTRLLMIGDGPLRRPLEVLIDELGLSQCVDLVGLQSNPFKFTSRADLFVLSSHWEGLANVLIEALAVGCPVVATDCDFGPREILDGGRFGLLTPPRDPNALATAILRALGENPSSTRRNRDQLKARARHFSVENAVTAYDAAFQSLLV